MRRFLINLKFADYKLVFRSVNNIRNHMNYPQQADEVSEHSHENLSQRRHPRMI